MKPPLAELLAGLPALAPRFYSIASSPLSQRRRIVIAATVVEYTIDVNVPGGSAGARNGRSNDRTNDRMQTEQTQEQGQGGMRSLTKRIHRRGLCTRWFEEHVAVSLATASATASAIHPSSRPAAVRVRFSLRRSRDFCLPADPKVTDPASYAAYAAKYAAEYATTETQL